MSASSRRNASFAVRRARALDGLLRFGVLVAGLGFVLAVAGLGRIG